MFTPTLSAITAEACVPEQLTHYVAAVSGRRAVLVHGYAAYVRDRHAVLVAYPGAAKAENWREQAELWTAYDRALGGAPDPLPPEPSGRPSLAAALEELAASCSSVTVLSPFRPLEAPAGAAASRDCYWDLPLPAPEPGQKLRNMLRRAGRELTLAEEPWADEHASLVRHYLQTRPLQPGTREIFASLPHYLTARQAGQAARTPGAAPDFDALSPPGVVLLAARRPDGSLAGFNIGDVSGLSTAFYMFAFRAQNAPPGTADLLLSGLVRSAEAHGHVRLNLGLAVNGGISFFKQKWRARPFMPCFETGWDFKAASRVRKGLLARLFG